MQVIIRHPELGPQTTRLSADVAAAATSSTVENTKGFATNDYVVFGALGEELSEIVKLTSVTANTTLGHSTGPVFAHAARTQVAQIKYNQIKIYRATTEAGSYALITTTDITPDAPTTIYDDTDGTSSSWYKVKYYNSTTTALSAYSSAIQGTGYTTDSLGSMTDEIMNDFNDEYEKDISREQIYDYLNTGTRKVTTEIFKFYPDYLRTYTTQDLTSGTAAYDLPTRFLGFVRVDVNLSSTSSDDAHKAVYVSEYVGQPNTTFYETEPLISIRGSEFVLRPTPTGSGRAFIWYWQYPEVMDEESDEHGLPYGARDVIVNYALYKAWLGKNEDKSNAYRSLYKDSLEDYLEFLASARQSMTPKHQRLAYGEEMYNHDIYYTL